MSLSLLGVTTGVLAAAIVVHVGAFKKQSELDDIKASSGSSTQVCNSEASCAQYSSLHHQLVSSAMVYTTLYAGAAFAAGLWAFVTHIAWTNPSTPEQASKGHLQPVVGFKSVGLGGSF